MRLLVELRSMYSNGEPIRRYDNVAKWKTIGYTDAVAITFDDGKKEIVTSFLRVSEKDT